MSAVRKTLDGVSDTRQRLLLTALHLYAQEGLHAHVRRKQGIL